MRVEADGRRFGGRALMGATPGREPDTLTPEEHAWCAEAIALSPMYSDGGRDEHVCPPRDP